MSKSLAISEEDWLKCEREFIEGKLQLKHLAIKYGLKYNTIRRRACDHGWGKMKAAYFQKVKNAPPLIVAEQMMMAERPIVLNGHAQEHFAVGNQTYLDEIPELTGMIAIARTNYLAAIDAEEAAKWMTCYTQGLERKRILMGIPLPAPIRQREKQAKGSTVAPISSGSSSSTPTSEQSSDKV